MKDIEDRYRTLPVDGDDSKRPSSKHWRKVYVAIGAGCLVLLISGADASVAVSSYGIGTAAAASTSLVGFGFVPPPVPIIVKADTHVPQQQGNPTSGEATSFGTRMHRNVGILSKATSMKDDMKRDVAGSFVKTKSFIPRPPANRIVQIVAEMPLGIRLELTDDGKVIVAEVFETGNAYSAGVRKGDILRATSCVVRTEDDGDLTRTGPLYWFGDEGQRTMFTVDGAPLDKVWAEISSNADASRAVILVLERIAMDLSETEDYAQD